MKTTRAEEMAIAMFTVTTIDAIRSAVASDHVGYLFSLHESALRGRLGEDYDPDAVRDACDVIASMIEIDGTPAPVAPAPFAPLAPADLTDRMIKDLMLEAHAAGDSAMVTICKAAIGRKPGQASEPDRCAVLGAINAARAMRGGSKS